MVFTSGEMKNPRKNLPTAARHFFVRLMVFYVLSTLAIGIICQSNSKDLTSSNGTANASPWVIAIRNAGISALPSIINAGILTSAWSAGNSYLYMSSRSLYSLAIAGNAPKIFARCNRYGLPIYAVIASSCFAPLAYLNCSDQAGTVFNWFISLTNTAGYTSWIFCCIIFFRFRKACEKQSISVPYQSPVQPWAAWVCVVLFSILLLCNGFTLFFPGQFTASGFLTTYLGIALFLVLYFGHRIVSGRNQAWVIKPEMVDLVTGVKEVEADAQMWTKIAQEQKYGRPAWLKPIALIWE